MRTLFLTVLLALHLLSPGAFAAQAAGQPSEPLVKFRLLPERGQVAAGEEIWIGIEQSIAPQWHTYWKNPGDSGIATRIAWTMPAGFEVGDVRWPVPEKIPYPPLLNYGYEKNAVLLQKLRVPDDLPPGPATLKADMEVLVCKEECIPEYASLSVVLNDPAAGETDNAPFLAAALDRTPVAADWPAAFGEENGNLVLTLAPPGDFSCGGEMVIFPADWGMVDNAAPARVDADAGKIVLTQKRGERPLSELERAGFVVSCKTGDDPARGVELIAQNAANAAANGGAVPAIPGVSDSEKTEKILPALLFALLGGLILNLMPCVFPVLSIKALSLVKTAEKSPALARLHGLSYTAGVVLSFVLIAAALIALKAGGAQIGWGFQLQNPYITGGLAVLLLLIGLNLAGVFELKNPFGNLGGKLAAGGGLSGSFFTGVLATLVATPCTAPFMAGAIAYALLQPAYVALVVFAALGTGLALPYLLLSFIPALRNRLPRPGRWMETFRRVLSVPMFLAALWLLWVLAQQIPAAQGRAAHNEGLGRPYSEQALKTALEGSEPVFVEMTAAWCITCKVNHAVAINVPSTRALFADMKIVYLVGDWTNEDPVITKFLGDYGRSGVPLYVFYGPRDSGTGERPDPKILPQVLTPGIVQRHIKGNT